MSAYSAAVLALSPSAYWRLGGNGTDATANARDLTIAGSPTASYPTGALVGDSDTAFRGLASIASASWMNTPSSLSGVIWFRSGGSNHMALMGRTDSISASFNNQWRLWVVNDGRIFIETWQANGAANGAQITTVNSPNYFDSAWHMVGFTWSSAGTLLLNVDGVQKASGSAGTALFTPTYSITVGQFQGGSQAITNNTIGELDEAALWYGTALTNTDYANLYALGTTVASHSTPIIRRPLRGLIVR